MRGLLGVAIGLSVLSLAWNAWIVLEPRYWFENAYKPPTAEVERLTTRLDTLDSRISAAETRLRGAAVADVAHERTSTAVQAFCETFRGMFDFDPEEYVVVIARTLTRGCDWAQIPAITR